MRLLEGEFFLLAFHLLLADHELKRVRFVFGELSNGFVVSNLWGLSGEERFVVLDGDRSGGSRLAVRNLGLDVVD